MNSSVLGEHFCVTAFSAAAAQALAQRGLLQGVSPADSLHSEGGGVTATCSGRDTQRCNVIASGAGSPW